MELQSPFHPTYPNSYFTTYTTPDFTVTQNSHVISFQGVGSAGGARMAFIDKVALSNQGGSGNAAARPSTAPSAVLWFSFTWAYSTLLALAGASSFTCKLPRRVGMQEEQIMRLGEPIFFEGDSPEQWVRAVQALGYRAAYCPLSPDASDETVRAFARAAHEADIVVAEVGAWSNPLSSNDVRRAVVVGNAGGKIPYYSTACSVNTPRRLRSRRKSAESDYSVYDS